jgi:hypothetical protein
MSTYNNTLRDLIAFLKSEDENNSNFSMILPTVLSIEIDGLSGIVIGNLFKINKDFLPDAYSGLDYVVRKVKHTVQNNFWTTTIEAYPFKNNNGSNNINQRNKDVTTALNNAQILEINVSGGGATLNIPISTKLFDQDHIKNTIQFLKSKDYNEYAIAGLVGGFLQESGLKPEKINSIGAYGIAQWLGSRRTKLETKSLPMTFNDQWDFIIEELNSSEAKAKSILKSAKTLEDGIKGAAEYERFNGYTTGVNGIFTGGEWGSRAFYSRDLLQRMRNGEF